MKPFIKWAGGKTQLLPIIREKYPINKIENIKYCEPFVGGGAVLLDILSMNNLKEVLINDINSELINTYEQIKLNIDALINKLLVIQNYFWGLSIEERKDYYYKKRERFNELKCSDYKENSAELAVLFIFLNKTCFNGLFRVNKNNYFNVPIGSYKKPMICDSDNLRSINLLLQNVTITSGDYKQCIDFVDRNTFVYIDPPYRPLTSTSNFTSYTKYDFDDNMQIELKNFIDKLDKIGANILLSNSDPKNNNKEDLFFDNLYKDYYIKRVEARRMINRDGKNRGYISELLISNKEI